MLSILYTSLHKIRYTPDIKLPFMDRFAIMMMVFHQGRFALSSFHNLLPAQSLRNHLWGNPDLGKESLRRVPCILKWGQGVRATPKVCENLPQKKVRHPWHLHVVSTEKVCRFQSDTDGIFLWPRKLLQHLKPGFVTSLDKSSIPAWIGPSYLG